MLDIKASEFVIGILVGVITNVFSLFLIGFLIEKYKQPYLTFAVGSGDRVTHHDQIWLTVRVTNKKMPRLLGFWTREVAADCHVEVVFREGDHTRFSMPGRWVNTGFPDVGEISISQIKALLSRITPNLILSNEEARSIRQEKAVQRISSGEILAGATKWLADELSEAAQPSSIRIENPHFVVEQTISIYPGGYAEVDIATRRHEWDFVYAWNSEAYSGLIDKYKLPVEKNYIIDVRVTTLGKTFTGTFKLTCGEPFEVFRLEGQSEGEK